MYKSGTWIPQPSHILELMIFHPESGMLFSATQHQSDKVNFTFRKLLYSACSISFVANHSLMIYRDNNIV